VTPAPRDIGFVHLIGIGGIGMSGIALMLDALGYRVQGSDLSGAPRLSDTPICVKTGHAAEHIRDASGALPGVVVMSSAIPDDNPELRAARAARVPVVRRADMLAELMRFKRALVIGGTHGKTTTTALVGHILDTAGRDPTTINGGILNAYGTNARMGASDLMVVESDESDGSFTRLPATSVLVTNIDPEHMEHYGSFDALRAAFRAFVEGIPFYGTAVLCADHPEVAALSARVTDRRIVTYGLDTQADWRAVDIRTHGCESAFDIIGPDGLHLEAVRLSMVGRHNVQNALGAAAMAWTESVRPDDIRRALGTFRGVGRRFTLTGEARGVRVFDDYAHHPVEIRAVLDTARIVAQNGSSTGQLAHPRVIAVMQPHRYTRVRDQFEGFCRCFGRADTVLISDVYAANESPIAGVTADALADGVRAAGHPDVRRFSDPQMLPHSVSQIVRPGDVVVIMGAGDCTRWAASLPEELAACAAA
jgi:UDP-N-acetylmuramate--alanine ligase